VVGWRSCLCTFGSPCSTWGDTPEAAMARLTAREQVRKRCACFDNDGASPRHLVHLDERLVKRHNEIGHAYPVHSFS
jgi:hypothetical protein